MLGLSLSGLSSFGLLGPPANGNSAEITITLPNAPALVGFTAFLQGIDVASLRLTNMLSATIVGW